MQRLFMLGRDEALTQRLVEQLKDRAPLEGPIRLLGADQAFAERLGVERGSLEELTNVRMARRRGITFGIVAGVALSLFGLLAPEGSLPLPAWLAITLAGLGGGALGMTFGTIAGAAQRHPIYKAHREELHDGAVLVAVEVPDESVEDVLALARAVDPAVVIEARTLTDDLVNFA